MIRSTLLVLVWVGCPTSAAAQATPRLSLGATLAGVRSVARDAGGRQTSTGISVGGALSIRAGRFSLTADYSEASLRADGASNERGLVEGSTTAAIQVYPWLAVAGNVTAHRAMEADPERWLTWGTSARLELPLIGRQVTGLAEFRQGLGGEVNIPNGGVRSQEGVLGLRFTLLESAFSISLSSRLGTYTAGGRTRTLEHFGIGVGWNAP